MQSNGPCLHNLSADQWLLYFKHSDLAQISQPVYLPAHSISQNRKFPLLPKKDSQKTHNLQDLGREERNTSCREYIFGL